jgi:hypothetical protein
MLRHHTGSGRRKTIGADWAAHHATAAIGAANALVTITGPAESDSLSGSSDLGPGWDPTHKATSPTAGAPIASDVPARIQALVQRGVDVETADETVTVPPYLVQLHRDLVVPAGAEISVTACAGDLQLQGRDLRVDDPVLGSERFTRDLRCTLIDRPTS